MKNYDVIFVGAGVATITAILDLLNNGYDGKILIIEYGKSINERRKNDRVYGFGGAGIFSDFKISISNDTTYPIGYSLTELEQFKNKFKYYYLEWPSTIRANQDKIEFSHNEIPIDIQNKLLQSSIRPINNSVYHLGELGVELIKEFSDIINSNVDVKYNMPLKISDISYENDQYILFNEFKTKQLVIAVGRVGFSLVNDIKTKFNLLNENLSFSLADIGIRLEFPQYIAEQLMNKSFDPKLLYITQNTHDRVRTFCANLFNGRVVIEKFSKIKIVNGYSPRYISSENTMLSNIAVLVSINFTKPHENITNWIYSIAKMANTISNGSVIVQRLADLLSGRRSTPIRISELGYKPTLSSAVPGDLALVLPKRILDDILEFIEKLDNSIFPSILRYGIAYGIEAKFYGNPIKYKINSLVETEQPGLFIIGDCSGHTRSIYGAALHGLALSNEIMGKH